LLASLAACGDRLPEHNVEASRLLEGQRVHVDAPGDITRDECISLIDKYRSDAEPNGQVSVHKFNKALGHLSPWCVENFDGTGVQFNEFGF
jgi:hypothetical protein